MAKLLQDVLDRLKIIEDDVETIELGVYGDTKNEVKGLIQNVRELQKAVQKLQDQWKKVVYFSAGGVAVIEIVWRVLKWITAN